MNLMVLPAQVHQGELLEPGRCVTVYARLHPFKLEQRVHVIAAGASIAEAASVVCAGQRLVVRSLVATIGDDVVPAEWWDRVRMRPGNELRFTAVPGEGGNIWRSLLLIAVSIAALALAPVAGLALGSAIGISSGLASAIVSGAITPAGGLIRDLFG